MTNLAVAGEINPHLCRFALIRGFEGRRPLFSNYGERLVADFPSPIEALRSWIETLAEDLPPHLTLAVAGPVGEDHIHIPQSGWTFSLDDFRSSLGFDRVEVLNTSAAAGRGLEQLVGAECIPLGGMTRPATPLAPGRYAIVRPDYGLGVAALIVDQTGSRVINTEAGHLAFAPGNPFEMEVLRALSAVYGRVSCERLISWPALTALHQAVASIEGVTAAPLSPLEVLLYGRTGADPACARTLDCFFGILGDFCGQVVLSLCSNQGVFLLGRTIQEAHDLVGNSTFRARFETQGRLSATVRELPTWAATSSTTLLTGAALNFLDRTGVADIPAPAPEPVRKHAPVAVSQSVVAAADVGLLALDADLAIAAANPRFWDGLCLRSADIQPGTPAAIPLTALVEAGVWSAEAAADFIDALRAGQAATAEWRATGGRVLRQVAAPLDGGGWVVTSHDVSVNTRRSVELEAIAASLRQARIEADAANQAKSAFLAIMSHEIRTPLNGVLGMAQAMDAEPLPPIQRERLDVIRESGESLLAILNDVLDLSKIEAGKLVLEEVAFDLEGLLKGAHATFTALANKRGVSFSCTTAPAARGGWRGDPTRVRQILYNLISNALKFTEAGGVRVHADPFDGGLRLTISDDGIGIPADKLDQLFDRFTQADETTTRRFGGTGLGLAVCADLARLMHGSIDVASTEGEGSTFTVKLKLARTACPVAANAAPDPAEAPATHDLARLRVLAAEDNSVNQLVLKTLLHQIGVELLVVDDGAQALTAWQGGAWDVILMDVQMPNMDGPTATRAIRAAEAAEGRPRTPIIALTANVMSHQIQDYIAAGMDSFVAKPLQVAALFEALRNVAEACDDGPARQSAAG